MSHDVKAVKWQQVSHSLFAVLLECCGTHYHWHTMHVSVVNNPDKLAASMNSAKQFASDAHEAAENAPKVLEGLIDV